MIYNIINIKYNTNGYNDVIILYLLYPLYEV